jgi:hypothetical protein
MFSKASEIYWKEKSVQLSCELDCSFPLLPPCMEHDIRQEIEAMTASAMAHQPPISIASDLDATVPMPSSEDEEAPLDVDSSTVLTMPNVGLPVEDNPDIQEEESKGEQGPILSRSALKRLHINQQQTTMTQYYGPPEEQQNKKKNKKWLNFT